MSEPKIILEGDVVTADGGALIPGADVYLKTAGGEHHSWLAVTDRNGHYVFHEDEQVFEGRYLIEAYVNGYEHGTATAVLGFNPLKINLYLSVQAEVQRNTIVVKADPNYVAETER